MPANEWEVPPPSNVTVEHDHKAVLYLPDGRALVRRAGFSREAYALPSMPETRRQVQRQRRTSEG